MAINLSPEATITWEWSVCPSCGNGLCERWRRKSWKWRLRRGTSTRQRWKRPKIERNISMWANPSVQLFEDSTLTIYVQPDVPGANQRLGVATVRDGMCPYRGSLNVVEWTYAQNSWKVHQRSWSTDFDWHHESKLRSSPRQLIRWSWIWRSTNFMFGLLDLSSSQSIYQTCNNM